MVDLSIVVQKHAECLKNRQLLFALLNDLFPDDKQMIHIVLFAYDSGLLKKIQASSRMDTLSVTAMANKIITNFGVQKSLAYTAVYLWLDAFSVAYERISNEVATAEQKTENRPYVGMVLQAKVTAVLDSILIMDIGFPGERAVLPKREWPNNRESTQNAICIGNKIQVIVRSFDDKGKYPFWLLSTRLPSEDPWERFVFYTTEGSVFTGCIERIMQYGFFVNIADDVVGFVHQSEYASDALYTEGQTVDVFVRNIDKERKRISLGIVE